jgi:transcriptional regulator with XRE-family HTH domain
MQDLDKQAMGRRIRQIRLAAGLRQWELARMLGTTQSAVHKYEHGVVPEPRRLVELAKIGGTSIEWVLTGQHWENGSEEQERPTPELLETACLFRQINDDGRETVDEALRIIREAVGALKKEGRESPGAPDPHAVESSLRDHAGETLRLLESAWRIQRAVLRQVSQDAEQRLGRRGLRPGNGRPRGETDGEGTSSPAATPR